MKISNYWKGQVGKKIKLFIEDNNKIRPRDGILKDIDDYHVILEIYGKDILFSRSSIKRMEVKDD